MNVKANEANKQGITAVAGALNVKSTPGQVTSERPLPRKAVGVAKGTAKPPSQAATAVKGAGKAGAGGRGKGQTKPVPAGTASEVVVTTATITASKPKALGKRDTLLATEGFVEGHNLAKFAVGHDGKLADWADKVPVPTKADILAARALRFGKGACSGAELSLACMLALTGRFISIEGIGHALVTLTNGGGGVRQNVVRNAISQKLAGYINPADGVFTGSDKTMFKLPNYYNSGFSRCAAVRPTELGLKLIAEALGGIENVPEYLRYSNAEIAALTEKAKAAKKAARDAKAASTAARVKVPVKRK